MFSLRIEGFRSRDEVQAFIDWYEGQGEQDASTWFECREAEGEIDCQSMNMNMNYGTKWLNNNDAIIKVTPR